MSAPSASLQPVAASAPGKLILCGEHAVVYGCPAIALPLASVRAHVQVAPGTAGSGMHIAAPDLGSAWSVQQQPDNPLSELVQAALSRLGCAPGGLPDLTMTIRSNIPIAGGMGSGAAVATAIVRALVAASGVELAPAEVSALVYRCEQRYHGTPSGIDNTVIAYEQAIWFVRQQPAPLIEPVAIAAPFRLVIGDTGVRSETRLPVGEVRRRWQADPKAFEALFAEVQQVVTQIRAALASGRLAQVGPLLDANQSLLEQIGVSSPELEHLVAAARQAGAAGAKLSGAGWGGVMLALVDEQCSGSVAAALRQAGAAQVLETLVQ